MRSMTTIERSHMLIPRRGACHRGLVRGRNYRVIVRRLGQAQGRNNLRRVPPRIQASAPALPKAQERRQMTRGCCGISTNACSLRDSPSYARFRASSLSIVPPPFARVRPTGKYLSCIATAVTLNPIPIIRIFCCAMKSIVRFEGRILCVA